MSRPAGSTIRTFSSVVDAPLADVFAWHERPGAVERLTPPWQPVKVAEEAGSLYDGRAVLALPGGLRWVAQHQPADYAAPYRFADELTSFPLNAALKWRHEHDFAAESEDRTRVTDRIDTQLPDLLLRPMFTYRHRQLADDLAAHRWAASSEPSPLTIAVTGSSGLIGSSLVSFLTSGGHRVLRLVRRPAQGDDEREWRPDAPSEELLDGVDALVHLAGAPIFGRFTDAHKRAVRGSRVGPTRKLAELVARTPNGPRVMVSASAVGYYGPDGDDRVLDEESPAGGGFVADVVADWEADTEPAERAGVRVVRIRTGIVQSPRGGVLALLRPLFTAGLGGRLGDGRQWTSWIDLDDLVDVYHRALVDDTLVGPVNAVVPGPVRNADYTRVLARVLRRPALLPVPSIGPELLLGAEGAHEFALASQRSAPARLVAAGHRFRRPDLEGALRYQLGRFFDVLQPSR
jgi:uncharacterized protein (TIGR01777 family)